MDPGLNLFVVLCCAGFVILVVGLVVVGARRSRGKIKARWEALAASLTEGRGGQDRVEGSYEGRPVTASLAKTQTIAAGNMPLSDAYTYSLEMTVAAPGQGLTWRVIPNADGWTVQADDPALRDGPGGAELVAATRAWQGRFPGLPSATAYGANSGCLFYQQTHSINPYFQDMGDSEGASYIPAPAQFLAHLELLSALATINARWNPPSAG